MRIVFSVPPRHGKTETIMHGLAQLVASDPTLQLCYATYAQRLAEKKSRKIRELAVRAGCALAADSRSRADWRTGSADGGLWATSVGGAITGEGFHCLVIDDSVKSRAMAESSLEREKAYEWLTDDAYTRIEPNGSILVNGTRWHTDDLPGRLIKDGWEHVNLAAISDEGAALWPERWSVDRLQEIETQLGPYGWNSLYQGSPRSRGGSLFQDVGLYTDVPRRFRVSIGVDLAYSKKTHADYSVAVVLAESDGLFYVLDVKRMQVKAPEFAATLRTLSAAYPSAPMRWYTSSIEREVGDLLRSTAGIPLQARIAKGDKFIRAQPVAASWNDSKILIPRSAPWVTAFIDEVCAFTGVNDRHDDQVDALAAAFDALETVRKAPDMDDLKAFQNAMPKARWTPGGRDDWDD